MSKHAAGKSPENELSFKRLRKMQEDVIDGILRLSARRQMLEPHCPSANTIGSNKARARRWCTEPDNILIFQSSRPFAVPR
jgi:hypothetical protein